MFYEDRGGRGIPIIFLHGTGCDSEDWAGVLAELPAGLRPIVTDFRGHGGSDTPKAVFSLGDLAADVLALVDHLRLSHVVLAGHSLGGMVALEAARWDRRIGGLLLLEGWTRLASASAFSGDRFYGALSSEAVIRIEQKGSDVRGRFDRSVWAAFWKTVEDADAFSFLEQTSVSVVEAYGSMGRCPDTEARLCVPRRPNIELKWIENAGHYLPHERPAEVAALCGYAAKRVGTRN